MQDADLCKIIEAWPGLSLDKREIMVKIID